MRSALLTLVASAIPCTPAVLDAQSSTTSGPIGCWALRLIRGDVAHAGWSLTHQLRGEADPAMWGAVHHPPDIVAVSLASSTENGRPAFEVRGAAEHYNRRGSALLAGDSTVMTWSNGLAGVQLRGMVEDSVYRGTARLITDVVTSRPLPDAGFEGVRVACPAALRIAVRPDGDR